MSNSKQSHPYHLVDPSPWPLLGSISALVLAIGAIMFMHKVNFGEWVFGLGSERSIYWKLGSHELSGASADTDWHVFSGTFGSGGTVKLRRDGYNSGSIICYKYF